MINYYNKDSDIITFKEFVDLFEDSDYRRVNITSKDNYIISTVWLGINQKLFANEKPMIFETLIFKDDEEFNDIYQQIYSTKEEALIGHDAIVENLEELVKNEKNNRNSNETKVREK
jgi:hypothetical protein